LRGLRLLGVGHLGLDGLVALLDEVGTDRLGGRAERGRRENEDTADVGSEHRRQLTEQVAADDDVVRLLSAHGDADGCGGHFGSSTVGAVSGAAPSAARIWAATPSGVSSSVSTRSVATFS